MWHIDNPLKVFKEVYTSDESNIFNLSCIMRTSKFDSFSDDDKNAINNTPNVSITDIEIKNPDNPAQLLDEKLIVMGVK